MSREGAPFSAPRSRTRVRPGLSMKPLEHGSDGIHARLGFSAGTTESVNRPAVDNCARATIVSDNCEKVVLCNLYINQYDRRRLIISSHTNSWFFFFPVVSCRIPFSTSSLTILPAVDRWTHGRYPSSRTFPKTDLEVSCLVQVHRNRLKIIFNQFLCLNPFGLVICVHPLVVRVKQPCLNNLSVNI